MAIGAITSSAAVGQDGSNVILELISFAGDGAYTTGGTLLFQAAVRAALGKGDVELLAVLPQDCGDNYPVYDKAADALKVFVRSTGAEVAGAANLAAVTFNLLVVCK